MLRKAETIRVGDANMAKSYDYLFKILLIGDSGVEKSKILFKFAQESELISTIGVDFKIKTIEMQGKKIKLQIWDTAGQERFHTITTSYYRGAMGIMVVYDITQEETFENISNWLRNIEEHAQKHVQVVIVGNKCHMEHKRMVTKEQGEQMAKERGLRFFEVSTETNENIKEAFYALAEDILTQQQLSKDSEEPSSNINVQDDEPDQKKGCFLA